MASFVNPHDIVLFPGWVRRSPIKPSPLDPPHVPAAPTAEEDLASKPAAQIAFREAYATGYGPAPVIERAYRATRSATATCTTDCTPRSTGRSTGCAARSPKAVRTNAVLVRTSDHGDLLGAHGGLHQKWFNLYDEATRVPFVIARIGSDATSPRTVTAPTSHVDLLPTLLAAAGVDVDLAANDLAESFSEVHPLPGQNLMPVVDGGPADDDRAVYIMTRDNMLEGDTGASAVARQLRQTTNPPAPIRIRVPAHVGSNFEGLVVRVDDHLWKLVRTFDDPATWTEPGVRHLAANGLGGEAYRMSPLDDQWELYDLTDDPTEADNRWTDPEPARATPAAADSAETRPGRRNPGAKPAVALRLSAGGLTLRLDELGGHLLEHAVVDDVEAGAGLGAYVRVADHGKLIVLLGFSAGGPVGRSGDDVDAVDDDHLQVHDRRLLTVADRDAVADLLVEPGVQQGCSALPFACVESRLICTYISGFFSDD